MNPRIAVGAGRKSDNRNGPPGTIWGGRVQQEMTIADKPKMKNRTPIHVADLYVLLQREFRRRQVPDCDTCYVQLPFLVDRVEPNAANWEMIIPASCSFGCREIMDEVVEELSRRYELLPQAGT